MNSIDVESLRPSEFYQHMVRIIVPRPIAWVSTRSPIGVDNIAPFSYFTGVGSRPPTLLFCPANRRDGTPKDSMANIEATGEFVVNVVTDRVAEAMNTTAAEISSDESEFEMAGLETVEAELLQVSRVKESPAQFECRLRELIRVGDGPGSANIVLGDILRMHLDPAILNSEGFVDPEQLDAVGRMGGLTYARTRDRFDLTGPS